VRACACMRSILTVKYNGCRRSVVSSTANCWADSQGSLNDDNQPLPTLCRRALFGLPYRWHRPGCRRSTRRCFGGCVPCRSGAVGAEGRQARDRRRKSQAKEAQRGGARALCAPARPRQRTCSHATGRTSSSAGPSARQSSQRQKRTAAAELRADRRGAAASRGRRSEGRPATDCESGRAGAAAAVQAARSAGHAPFLRARGAARPKAGRGEPGGGARIFRSTDHAATSPAGRASCPEANRAKTSGPAPAARCSD
jgi:hypothetical protein